MSAEGHTRILCEQGHLRTIEWHGDGDVTDPCPVCASDAAWTEEVDTTIGWTPELEAELIPSADGLDETYEIPID